MPLIKVNGTTVFYTDTGYPAGVPNTSTIFFGHGLLFSGWVFHPQIAALRHRYRCVTIDWRGQGETPAAAGGYDMDTLAGDAVAVIQQLEVAPVHWVGLSMGGFIGQRVAARHDGLVRSLTLLDTSAGREEPGRVGEYKILALCQCLVGIRPLLSRIKPLLFGPEFLANSASRPVIAEWLRRLNATRRAGLRKAVLGVANRMPVDREITRITAPTLVVVGADDAATPPERSEDIAARIPDAQLIILADCGHTSTLEQPATITRLLDLFIAGIELSRQR